MREEPGGCVYFSFGVLVIMALIGFLAVIGAAPDGTGGTTTTDSNNRTNVEVNILSNNFSPVTTINSNNTTQDTTITGDRNAINMNPPCFAWQGVDGDPNNPRLCVSWQDMKEGSPRPQP